MKLTRVVKDYRESRALSVLVNVLAALDEQTFLTKGGDLLMVLAVEGQDYECLDASQLDETARRFESTIRVFDPHFRIYQYLMKHNHATIPARAYDNPVVQGGGDRSSCVSPGEGRSALLH